MAQEKRVALVTGGAVRVGRAIVEKLAAEGFAVAFTYRSSEAEATKLATQIDGHAIRADLVDPDIASKQVHASFLTFANRLDLLVNNASVYRPARLRDTDMALMRETAAVNVQAPLLLCQKFESLLRQSRGHVVNMCDLLGEKPWPEYLIYCASKAALANLTTGLARELAPEVTVNGIAPGVVQWPDGYPLADREKYLKRVPLARPGTPEDVAKLVHFLATEGSYITGQIIRLDGGRSIT
ncbi:MAG: SDR family oxidoreductase [Anaerolineae bacterium]|nr:SDR family oxidoreductase [Phycisphaerae bacterium]